MASRCSCVSPQLDSEPAKDEQKDCACEPLQKKQKVDDSDSENEQLLWPLGDSDFEFTDDGIHDDFPPNDDTCRDFTLEESEEYDRRVGGSEGFDAPYFPQVGVYGLIMPYSLQSPEELDEHCRLAIRDYSAQNNVKYEFVKLVKVTHRVCSGTVFYITFEAKAKHADAEQPRIFEARTWGFLGKIEIDFCRIKRST